MIEPIPLRPPSEVVGGFFTVILGGSEYRLVELPRGANGEWLSTGLAREIRATLEATGPVETLDEVVKVIVQSAEAMMDLLISYDAAGARAKQRDPALPDREWIDTHATDREVYEAIKKVTKIAIPFQTDLFGLIPELRPMLLQAVSKGVAAATIAMVSTTSTSSSPPSTAGQPTTSNATSPSPKSGSTPRKPPSGARRRTSRTSTASS